ncbi:MAG: hypothetical protein WCQ60_01145 [bacterium]
MNINDKEIARLLRVLSEPLRKNWEIKFNQGKSLLELQLRRTQLLGSIALLRGRCQVLYYLGLGVLILAVVAGITWMGWSIHHSDEIQKRGGFIIAGLSIVLFASVAILKVIFDNKTMDLSHELMELDAVFEKLQQSVDSLNPLGIGNTHHDVHTEKTVTDMAVGLGFKVLDATDRLFKVCARTPLSRHDIAHSLQWEEKCSAWFAQLWDVAIKDFGLKLDKTDVFKQAAASLARHNAK